MPNPRFPRAQPADNVVINGTVWNALVDQVEKLARLDVSPPLYFSLDNSAGKTISLTPVLQPVTLKILDYYATGASTGTGAGRYKTVRGVGTVANLDPTTNESLPDANMTFGSTADSIWVNLYENGTFGTAVVGKNDFVTGYYVGNSTSADSATPLPVYYGSSGPALAHFEVALTQTGGSDGSRTTAASWTYDLKTLDGSLTLVTGAALQSSNPRPNGKRTKATAGEAYIAGNGAIILAVAYENYTTVNCP